MDDIPGQRWREENVISITIPIRISNAKLYSRLFCAPQNRCCTALFHTLQNQCLSSQMHIIGKQKILSGHNYLRDQNSCAKWQCFWKGRIVTSRKHLSAIKRKLLYSCSTKTVTATPTWKSILTLKEKILEPSLSYKPWKTSSLLSVSEVVSQNIFQPTEPNFTLFFSLLTINLFISFKL